MSELVTYTMNHRGFTDGAVTGRQYRYDAGEAIEAPDGEFRHLPASDYKTSSLDAYNKRPLDAGPGGQEPPEEGGQDAGDLSIVQKGRYFYVVRKSVNDEGDDGEEVLNHLAREDGENKGLEEEDAQKLLTQLKTGGQEPPEE